VQPVENIKEFDVFTQGRSIRRGAPYFDEGTNVNFVEHIKENKFAVRTYERGVEDETLSCGTGVTAVAIAMHNAKITNSEEVKLETPGGELTITFNENQGAYSNVYLEGPATLVFKGTIEW